MFGRTRYQGGSLRLEERKRGPAVWVYRWWEKDTEGKPIRRKAQLGNLDEYPNESKAQAAADALRLTINEQTPRQQLKEIKVTADTYTQAVTLVKRDAQARIAKLIMADGSAPKAITPTLQ